MGAQKKEPQLLESAYRSSFELAKENKLKSIAFPAISTGVYAYPIEEATRIALKVGKEFENEFDEIFFICFSAQDLEVYHRLLREFG